MTIETKKAANVKEALEILNSLLPNGSFTYATENYSDDYKATNRHFTGTAENGATCYGLIENIVAGNLVSVRFVNIYREIAVDIVIENFTCGELAIADNNDSATNAEIELANTAKKTKKLYSINPVINDDQPIKFNHLDIFLTADGALQIDGFFQCKRITTAYNCFKKIMVQAAADIPQLKGWGDCWTDAKSISELDGNFFNENGDLLFNNSDPRDTLAVDINEDQFYFFANFPAASKPLEGFDYDAAEREEIMSTPLVSTDALEVATNAEIELANAYQPQTHWVNPHDFTITGDLSGRNINGRIFAHHIDRQQQLELADMKADGVQYLLKVITPQLHSFRKFDFRICTNTYKSFDALKQLGANRILDQLWRIETIDGKLLAKGAGIADFNLFFNHKEEPTLTVNQHNDFHSKLAELQANVAAAKAVRDLKKAAFDRAEQEFNKANDAVFDAQYAIIQLGNAKAKELQNSLLDGSEHIEINFSPISRKFVIYEIHEMDVPKELATCATPELVIDAINHIKHADNFSLDDFEEHLLALQKEQEDAYPDEVKEINRELAQSNFTAPMWLHIRNNGVLIKSFADVELKWLSVKSFVTDKIHFGVHYADEPLEGYNTFEEVITAINQLKAAITRGDKEFTFPTADELNLPQQDTHVTELEAQINKLEPVVKALQFASLAARCELIPYEKALIDGTVTKKQVKSLKSAAFKIKKEYVKARDELIRLEVKLDLKSQPALHPTAKQINDSLIRAMETNLKNIQAHCLNLDINAAVDELNLYHICNNALLKKEVA